MVLFFRILSIGALVYGAVVDYRKREIPDVVPITLLLTGVITGWGILGYRIAEMLIIAAVFLISAKIYKTNPPGGDFKLLCALTFAFGIPVFFLSMLLTGLAALVVGSLKKQPEKRHIPLCTYIAPSVLCVGAINLIL